MTRGYARWRDLRFPETASRLREIEESQWWSRERLAETSSREVEATVRRAAAAVPYYRDWFRRAGLVPREFRFDRDFQRLPVVGKRTIQEQGEQFLPEGADRSRWRRNRTGGSTGQMLAFFHDARYEAANQADKSLTYRWCGYRPGDPWAFLWGIDRDSPVSAWRRFQDRALLNRLWLDAFDLAPERLLRWAREVADARPVLLVGYTSALAALARMLRDRGGAGGKPVLSVRSIQTTAETLQPSQRTLIEETFGGKAFDRYGCREVGNVAQECEAHQGLHLLTRTNFAEILVGDRPARPGETGHLVVTNLTNGAFPFLRYDTEDLAVAGPEDPCPCGRGLPKIGSVEGRVSDMIVTPEGRMVHGEFFTHLFYAVDGVAQFQVEQIARDHLILRLVREPSFREESLAELSAAIHRQASPSFRIDFEFPASIPATASGKFRYTLSNPR